MEARFARTRNTRPSNWPLLGVPKIMEARRTNIKVQSAQTGQTRTGFRTSSCIGDASAARPRYVADTSAILAPPQPAGGGRRSQRGHRAGGARIHDVSRVYRRCSLMPDPSWVGPPVWAARRRVRPSVHAHCCVGRRACVYIVSVRSGSGGGYKPAREPRARVASAQSDCEPMGHGLEAEESDAHSLGRYRICHAGGQNQCTGQRSLLGSSGLFARGVTDLRSHGRCT